MLSSTQAAGVLLLGGLSFVEAQTSTRRAALDCSDAGISYPSIPGATITSLTAASLDDYNGISGNNVCQVNVTLTHSGTGDDVNTQVLLPLSGWNTRFQGVGGGGYAAGSYTSLASIAAEGYACATTDAGHSLSNSGDASSWALVSEGNVNQYLLLDFAHRSYHDMTMIGKAVTESFYG